MKFLIMLLELIAEYEKKIKIWLFRGRFKQGQKVKIIKCADEWIGIQGEIVRTTKYGEYHVKIHKGNIHHRKGTVLYFPRHLIKKIE